MPNILLVEDAERIALCVSRELQAHGFQVTHATNSEAAAESFQAVSFDLIILDIGHWTTWH